MDDRSAKINIGGREFELILTTRATPEDKQELLTQETVELLTSPLELAEYKSAIMEAMFKGTKRNVESENNSKNAPVG